MTTLNIKSFPDRLYNKLKIRAKKERRSLAQEVIKILDESVMEPQQFSILELEGLGKEIWQGSDTGKYVERERNKWD